MKHNLLQLGRQLRGIWGQLGLNQRISIVLAGAAVLAGGIALMLWSGRIEYGLLFGKLPEAEAAKVIAVLEETKVPYRVGSGGGAIYVPAERVYALRMQLASRGVPQADGVGFEIFDKSNFGISDFVQRANYLRALQGELARTIGQLDEVEAARVLVVLPEHRLLADNQRNATASVFIRVRGRAQLQPSSISAIRFLVANAVEGLKANNVTVVDNQGNVLSENTEPDSLAGLSTTQLQARRNLEQYLAKKAESMLERVMGPNQAVVRVAAEINFDTVNRTEEKYDPDAQVVRVSTINDENTDSTTSTPNGGAPGVTTNTGSETNSTTALPQNNTKTRKKLTNNQYELNRTTSTMLQAAGGVKKISAAVFVAQRMEGTPPNRKAVPRSPQELEKLQQIVQSALGLKKEELTLAEMPFNDALEVTGGQQLEQQERRQWYWDVAKTLLYPALAALVLLGFWRTFRKTPVEEIPLGVPLGELAAIGGGNGYEAATANGSKSSNGHGNGNGNGHGVAVSARRTPPGVVTVDVLNRLVRENPENVTQALRAWLSRSASN